MKTKSYLIITILVGIMLISFTNKSNATRNIIIQSDDPIVTTMLLSQSAEIISNRLKDYSAKKFELEVLPEKNQIKVELSDNWDVKLAEKLATYKGELGFYLTYNRLDVNTLPIDSSYLFSLLKYKNKSEANLGSCTIVEKTLIDSYLQSLDKNKQSKFVWYHDLENSEFSLYALRLETETEALLNGKDIESITSGKDLNLNFIEINFKESATKLWANITRQNTNQPIAIVLDDTVLCSPIIRSSIENGKSLITGNFSEEETKVIVALIRNHELPLTFHYLK
jgi:preprotein translocase subunit SecD